MCKGSETCYALVSALHISSIDTYQHYISVAQTLWNWINSSGGLPSSSSIGTTAHCGLWPVEQCPSIFSYLPPTLSIFSLPALEDLFLLPLSIFSWVFPFFSSLPILEWRSFWGILSSSILSRWPNQLILCPFIHFTIFSPLLIYSSSRFVQLFHSLFSYLRPYILLNISLSKISRACSSFSVNVHVSSPYNTTGLISALYNFSSSG